MMLARRSRPLAALIILLAVFGSHTARGQDKDDLGALNQQVVRLYQAGKYVEATVVAKRALALSERQFGPDHLNVATSLAWLAFLYRDQGRLAEAEPLIKRALAIHEKALGPEHPDVGTDLNNLAWVYQAQGRLTEAEPLYQRALAIG